jgi:ABC-type nickel/cobalt efflux system permease component RcnA
MDARRVAWAVVSSANRTLRGFLILIVVSIVIVALRLEATLAVLYLIAKIAFLLAIAFFCYLLWREHRSDIETWPARARGVFYGAAALIVADIAALSFFNESGLDAVAFVLVLAAGGFAMWRTWRDQHTYV